MDEDSEQVAAGDDVDQISMGALASEDARTPHDSGAAIAIDDVHEQHKSILQI